MSKYSCPNCNERVSPMGHDCTSTLPCNDSVQLEGGTVICCQGLKKGHVTKHHGYLRSAAGALVEVTW